MPKSTKTPKTYIGSKLQRELDRNNDRHEHEEDYPLGRGRPVASRIHNQVHRLRGSMPKIRFHLPRIGNHYPVKPMSKGPAHQGAKRRAMVKVAYVTNKKPGQWQAHGKYAEREGAQKEGGKGKGFDAREDEVSLHTSLNQWQEEGDPHLFKVILSPEDGSDLDLKEYTRVFMHRVEAQLGKSVEWAAIDHYNTSHPHVHLLIRGKDGLQLSPDLIRRGMRSMAEDIATERLGYKSELEVLKAREHEVGMRRLTNIDRDIAKRQRTDIGQEPRTVITEPVMGTHKEQVARRLRIARLEKLEEFGVAEKVGSMTWALEAGWEKALKEMENLQTRTKLVAQARALMTDPRCTPVVTRVKPGERLVGRVLGTGLDEQYDRSYILVEGVDNKAHLIYQTAGIEKERAQQHLQPRALVAIEGRSFEKDGKTIAYAKITEYGLSIPDQKWRETKLPDQSLDDDLDWREKAGKPLAEQGPSTGFAAYWHTRLLERSKARQLRKAKTTELQTEEQKARPDVNIQSGQKPAKARGSGEIN